ncbi:MAG: hypothetical protein JW776_14110 [Candidatus Lokiarchaeota archaeon]|nr:hypothetical protein [Candidatus Lokiarchaeota archaeon]
MNRKNRLYFFFSLISLMIFIIALTSPMDETLLLPSVSPDISSINLPLADPTYLLWETSWGGSNLDFAQDVWADQYYIYVCGTLDADTTNPKLILARYSEWGGGYQDWNVTWTIGMGVYGNAVWSNSYFIYTAGTSSDNLVLIKWDSEGNQIWNTTWYLGGNYGVAHSVWGIENEIYLSGVYSHDLLLIKWDDYGSQIWNRTWGGGNWEEGIDVWGINNEIYTCGSTSSYGSGLNDTLIVKWDSDGNQLWNRSWGTPYEEYYTSMFGFDTSLYFCGNIWNETDLTTDMLIMKWDSDGNELWYQIWSLPEEDKAYSIWANEFYVFVCGTTLGREAEYEKVVLAKYSYNGILVETSYPKWNDDYHYIPKSIFAYNNYLYVCGGYNGSAEISGDYDLYLLKFYSYSTPPAPYFTPIEPNPSLNGTYYLNWQYFPESEGYHLYRDIHPILDISGRIPYKILTSNSLIETGMEEGTYFYVVTCIVKGIESEISNPRVVLVDLPDPPDNKVPGYNIFLIIIIPSLALFIIYKNKIKGRKTN